MSDSPIRPAVRLVVKRGVLHFPAGGLDLDSYSCERKADIPSMLTRRYDAGDCDTVPFPLPRGKAKRQAALKNLAHALYDERERNSFFPRDSVIELPDGKVFDFEGHLTSV